MTWSSLAEVDADTAAIEALVDATPQIDPWCSGPDWFLPAHHAFSDHAFSDHAFSEGAQPLTWSESGTGAVLLSQAETEDGAVFVSGLEPMWGFTSPLLGPHLPDLAEFATEHLRRAADWDICAIAGLPLSETLAQQMARPFSSLGHVQALYGIVRQVADLRAGHDAWLSSRSARFRKNLRQAERRAADVGVTFVDVSNDPLVYPRCVSVEHSSWKGQTDDGITSPGMHTFYEIMTARLQRTGRLRATIAQLDGHDVGFIFGGVRNKRYRGLQLSYTESARHLSISHLLQHHTIQRLIDEGVHTYDMGMDMDYKRRWATHEQPSMSLIVHRTSSRKRGRFG